MATVTVMLVLAAGPGLPGGSTEHRLEIELALDAAGRPDGAAWTADPVPWRARRIAPGEEPVTGAVQYDPDTGWSIRFYGAAADSPDAPESGFDAGSEPVRPGEYMTITEPDGATLSYRVVGVG